MVAALLLASAILLSVVQFRSIDESTVDRFDAIHHSDTADIFTLAYLECGWCRDRYGMHLALRHTAPGATVIVAASSPYAADRYWTEQLTERLYAVAWVAEVTWADREQDPGLLATPGAAGGTGFDPNPFIIASGPGGEKGVPWALAVDPSTATGSDDPDGFVARALRNPDHQTRLASQPEFVLLRWDVPRDGFDYQDLMLETSLLPVDIRDRLTR